MTRPVWRPARQTLAEVLDASPPPQEECHLIRPRCGGSTGPSLSRCPPSHPLVDSRSGTEPATGDANRRRGQMNGDHTGPGPDSGLRPRPRRQTQTAATDSDRGHRPRPRCQTQTTVSDPDHGVRPRPRSWPADPALTPPRPRNRYSDLCPLCVPDPVPVGWRSPASSTRDPVRHGSW